MMAYVRISMNDGLAASGSLEAGPFVISEEGVYFKVQMYKQMCTQRCSGGMLHRVFLESDKWVDYISTSIYKPEKDICCPMRSVTMYIH